MIDRHIFALYLWTNIAIFLISLTTNNYEQVKLCTQGGGGGLEGRVGPDNTEHNLNWHGIKISSNRATTLFWWTRPLLVLQVMLKAIQLTQERFHLVTTTTSTPQSGSFHHQQKLIINPTAVASLYGRLMVAMLVGSVACDPCTSCSSCLTWWLDWKRDYIIDVHRGHE